MAATILYVEDNAVNADVMRRRLGNQDVEVHVASDGEAGIQMAKDLQPDVILMDINMPGMDGVEVMRRIRDACGTADIPIVMVTAHISSRTRAYAEAMGCNAYLHKPVEQGQLLAALAEFIPVDTTKVLDRRSA